MGVWIVNMVLDGFMPRRRIDQTSDVRKGRIERISYALKIGDGICSPLYRCGNANRGDLGQFERERRPEDTAVARHVEAVARGVHGEVGIVVGDAIARPRAGRGRMRATSFRRRVRRASGGFASTTAKTVEPDGGRCDEARQVERRR